jgi:deazaflavin-dependent oxidoreductase (nitroreductase family)
MRGFFLSVLIFLYRSSGGRIGGRIGKNPVLLLTTKGRRSGKPRTVPVMYFMDDSAYIVTASAAGAQRNPGWFFNVRSNPQATIEVGRQRINVVGEVASPEKRAELWTRLLEIAPGFANYQKHVSREIPMVILRPADEQAQIV